MRQYSTRDFIKILKKNGFFLIRMGKGDHMIFQHKDGRRAVIPAGKKSICAPLTTRLIKENNLKV